MLTRNAFVVNFEAKGLSPKHDLSWTDFWGSTADNINLINKLIAFALILSAMKRGRFNEDGRYRLRIRFTMLNTHVRYRIIGPF